MRPIYWSTLILSAVVLTPVGSLLLWIGIDMLGTGMHWLPALLLGGIGLLVVVVGVPICGLAAPYMILSLIDFVSGGGQDE